MPFVAAPNIVSVEIRGTKDGRNVENRIYVNVAHTPLAADLLAISTALGPIINGEWRPILPTDVNLTELHLRSLHSQNDIELTTPFFVPSPGTAAGAPLPNMNTVCASLRTAFTGRSARGRLYWMGLTENNVAGNLVDLATLNSIQSALRSVRNAMTGLGYFWAIVSFISNGIPRPGGPVYFPVQDIIFVDTQVDSQRGRMH